MKLNRPKSTARLFLRQRYEAKSSKVYRKIVLAPEILNKIVKSLPQDCSIARDMKQNCQKSVARLFYRQRYEAKSSKVYRKIVLALEILSKIAKSLTQGCYIGDEIKQKCQKNTERVVLRT